MGAFAYGYGPALSNFGGTQTPADGANGTVDNSHAMYFDNSVIAGYKIDPHNTIGGAFNFAYQPVLGGKLTLEDPAIRLTQKDLIKTDSFSMTELNYVYLPVSTKSQNANKMTQLRGIQLTNWEPVKGSRWTLQTWSSERYNVYNAYATNANSRTDWDLYFAPVPTYAITPALQFVTPIEFEATHTIGNSLTSWDYATFDVEPGLSWDINSHITINPYFNIYPGNFNLDATSFGVNIFASIL